MLRETERKRKTGGTEGKEEPKKRQKIKNIKMK